MSTTINRDEWLKALGDAGLAGESDESAVTVNEFAEMFGIPRTTATGHLNILVRTGKAVRTQKHGTTAGGKHILFVAYRLES